MRMPTAEVPQTPTRSWLKKQVALHAYVPETLGSVGLLAVLNLAFMPAQPGFIGISPNPFWAVILLVGARYGFRASFFSATTCAIVYYALVATRIGDEVLVARDLLLWQYAKPAVLFLVVGVIVGMLVQRSKDRIARLDAENTALARENETLKRGEQQLRDVNIELANRVVGATDTLPMLYKYAKKLNSLNIDEVCTSLTELVMEVLNADQVSVYRVDGKRALLHSRNGERNDTGEELSIDPNTLAEVVERRQTFSLHDLLARNSDQRAQQLFLCGPLAAGKGAVDGVLAVERLDFLRYNPAAIRMFGVIIDWAADCLELASTYRDKPEERKRQENKVTVMRAQRATIAPGSLMAADVIGALKSKAAAGEVNLAPSGTRLGLLPTATVTGRSAGSTLSELLTGAEQQLFGSSSPNAPHEPEQPPAPSPGITPPVATLPPLGPDHAEIDPDALAATIAPGDRQALQHMLSGELEIADARGHQALTRLLAEIDTFLGGKKRPGSF